MIFQEDIVKGLGFQDRSGRATTLYGEVKGVRIRVSNHLPSFSNVIEDYEIGGNNKLVFVFLTSFNFKMNDNDCEEFSDNLREELEDYFEENFEVEAFYINEEESEEDFRMSMTYINSRINVIGV